LLPIAVRQCSNDETYLLDMRIQRQRRILIFTDNMYETASGHHLLGLGECVKPGTSAHRIDDNVGTNPIRYFKDTRKRILR
jgi:hypothetical protein